MQQNTAQAGSLAGCFTVVDWLVVVGYFVLISYLGLRLAGKQKSMEDFFRGGNRLPWYAVTGSMIATIISAVTFVAVPATAYAETGNFTYLQFGIVAGLLSRLFVAGVLVPAYFRYRIYSPYDYMGRQLGPAARSVTTILFSVLGLLGQAARVYLTAMILELVLRDLLAPLHDTSGFSSLLVSISLVGAVAIAWTMIGGIATVVWTDAMLFLVFVVGGITAIATIGSQITGGPGGGGAAGVGRRQISAICLHVVRGDHVREWLGGCAGGALYAVGRLVRRDVRQYRLVRHRPIAGSTDLHLPQSAGCPVGGGRELGRRAGGGDDVVRGGGLVGLLSSVS